MVPSGARLTFDVQGSTGGYFIVDDTTLRNEVVQRLSAFFSAPTVEITRGSTLANIVDFQWLHWNYSAVITLKTRIDYSEYDDIGRVIANAFYNAGGALPTVTSRDAGDTQGPAFTETGGVADFGASIEDLIAKTSAGVGTGLDNLFKPLTDLFKQTEYLVIGGIVLIVALIVFSPAGRTAARSLGRAA